MGVDLVRAGKFAAMVAVVLAMVTACNLQEGPENEYGGDTAGGSAHYGDQAPAGPHW